MKTAFPHLGVKVECNVGGIVVLEQQRLLQVDAGHLLHLPRPVLEDLVLIAIRERYQSHVCSAQYR